MASTPTRTGPLAGLKVLDLTRILAGPSATQLLGDMGADVVKVERPGQGDDTRAWGPPFVMDADGNPTSESGYYLSANRNKRSLAIDITAPEGIATLHRMVAKADILIENFKKDGLAKYQLDYATLAKINPAADLLFDYRFRTDRPKRSPCRLRYHGSGLRRHHVDHRPRGR